MPDEDEGLEPIETEPITGGDEVDDSILGIETDEEFRTASETADITRESKEGDDS